MLKQFSGEGPTLATLGEFPKEVYPVGRLDKDSEGLLLLTDDKWLNHQLLNPRFGHQRTYYVQVEGIPTPEALAQLQVGVHPSGWKAVSHQACGSQVTRSGTYTS